MTSPRRKLRACVVFYSLGFYRRRPLPACCPQEVQRDLHGLTAAQASHGALVSAPDVATEAHGLLHAPDPRLLGDDPRF